MSKPIITYRQMQTTDFVTLSPIMRAAFIADAKAHGILDETFGPTGFADGSLIEKLYFLGNMENIVCLMDGACIGAYTLKSAPMVDDKLWLEMFYLSPHLQNQNIGSKIWQNIEQSHQQITYWQTETPRYSKRNYFFYTQKCGFKVKEEKKHSYIFEKVMK